MEENLFEKIYNGIKNSEEQNYDFIYDDYKANFSLHVPNKNYGFNIPYILVIPEDLSNDTTMALEVNNLETLDAKAMQIDAIKTAALLAYNLKDYNAPVVVPILPSMPNHPYYQQLSKECFDNKEDKTLDYRYDLQIKSIIHDAQNNILNQTGKDISNKIFLNGYSSSGVFAERFALLHPEMVKCACIGGASGSIPVPSNKIGYPIGIKDFKEITGYDFDYDAYRDVDFSYYAGSLEGETKFNYRKDDNGNLASVHDMSYYNRSVPTTVGQRQREIFGKDMLSRAQHTINYLNEHGITATHTILDGYTHNAEEGTSVTELSSNFIQEEYSKTKNKGLKK